MALTRAEREEQGRALRSEVPRSQHADWTPRRDRDPVGILEASNETRVPELIPYRFGRMAISPFAFYRGSAAVMAADLADTPVTGLRVQACGDAHVSNFGEFATPERRLVFDINDFDETLPGAWEWDIKRLAASIDLVARRSDRRPGCEAGDRVARRRANTANACGPSPASRRWISGTRPSPSTTSSSISRSTTGRGWPGTCREHDGRRTGAPCRSSPRRCTGIAGSSSRRRSSSDCIGPNSTSTTRWASSTATGRRSG